MVIIFVLSLNTILKCDVFETNAVFHAVFFCYNFANRGLCNQSNNSRAMSCTCLVYFLSFFLFPVLSVAFLSTRKCVKAYFTLKRQNVNRKVFWIEGRFVVKGTSTMCLVIKGKY